MFRIKLTNYERKNVNLIMFSERQKKILGRWLEGTGLGVISGVIMGYLITDVLYWYYLLSGMVLIVIGALLRENQIKVKD